MPAGTQKAHGSEGEGRSPGKARIRQAKGSAAAHSREACAVRTGRPDAAGTLPAANQPQTRTAMKTTAPWIAALALGSMPFAVAQSDADRADTDDQTEPDPVRSTDPISQVITDVDELETFETLVAAAGLEAMLRGPGSYTVFAPSNEAFEQLPQGTLEMLQAPANQQMLRRALLHHIIGANVSTAALSEGEVTTNAGKVVNIRFEGDRILVDRSEVVERDLQANNGVVHVVNQVLLPESNEPGARAAETDAIGDREAGPETDTGPGQADGR